MRDATKCDADCAHALFRNISVVNTFVYSQIIYMYKYAVGIFKNRSNYGRKMDYPMPYMQCKVFMK